MPQIIPIKELKDTTSISERCHSSDEPIYVTKNGYGDMVIMSLELYEATQKKWDLYKKIELSEKQIAQGDVEDAKDVLASLRKKYDL